jgi:hypothetical protein
MPLVSTALSLQSKVHAMYTLLDFVHMSALQILNIPGISTSLAARRAVPLLIHLAETIKSNEEEREVGARRSKAPFHSLVVSTMHSHVILSLACSEHNALSCNPFTRLY